MVISEDFSFNVTLELTAKGPLLIGRYTLDAKGGAAWFGAATQLVDRGIACQLESEERDRYESDPTIKK